ncbi:restriction endonuclease subunit S [Methyloparacoccus murrellii]
MSFPRYPKYKDSGVEWLGEVPEGWEVKRIRHVATLNPSKSEVANLARDTEVSFLPMEAVGEDGKLNLERTRPISEVDTGYTYFREGDITIAKITPCYENGKGAVMRGLINNFGFGTTELTVVRPRENQTTSDYLHRLFNSTQFRKLGEAAMYGAGGQKRVPDDFVRDFSVGFPPIGEQQAIADFLDRETAKIDALVAEQENLIALLKEKRQAVISHAVTKGLDPTVPMKDSGIEWLGEVPRHWDVRRVKDVAKLESGHTPSKTVPEYWEDCDIPWVSLNDSKQLAAVDYITNTAVQINSLGLANSSARMLPEGSVVFTRDATIGLAAITTRSMAVSQHLIAWCPSKSIDSLFLLRVFNAMKVYLDAITFGATLKTIGMADVKKLVTPVPPIMEQRSIAAFIDTETAKLDDLTTEARHTIDLLKERRSALISAAVTGKIDVRGYHGHSQATT